MLEPVEINMSLNQTAREHRQRKSANLSYVMATVDLEEDVRLNARCRVRRPLRSGSTCRWKPSSAKCRTA